MSAYRNSKTTIPDIIKYWEVNIYEGDLSIDFSEAHERCWRCGYKSKLEKCHIIPHSLGGPDSPDNYVLLCSICHSEGPNIDDRDFFWDWLKAHKAIFYNTYWITRGMQEYELVYKKSIVKELLELNISPDNIKPLLQEQINKCSWHFGQPRMNPATIAGLFYMIVKGLKA
ncbi:MAG TPA: HNH endonuclease signature motif containing protein [Mucilaginibacter sp.]|jgi:hypothetical protein|nr:HNH endonuclease signature motif containing protein [Mucilaginibacter sp.]